MVRHLLLMLLLISRFTRQQKSHIHAYWSNINRCILWILKRQTFWNTIIYVYCWFMSKQVLVWGFSCCNLMLSCVLSSVKNNNLYQQCYRLQILPSKKGRIPANIPIQFKIDPTAYDPFLGPNLQLIALRLNITFQFK